MKQKFDPNLREAMDEIREILKRRNIAAHVLLASKDFYEFGLFYDIPSWSAINFEKVPDGSLGIRIRAKAEEREKMDATVGMICTFKDMMANGYGVMLEFEAALRKKMTILHLNRIGTDPDAVPEF